MFRYMLSVCSEEAASDSIIYSYKHGFSGFAAKLTDSQVEYIAGTFFFFILKHVKLCQYKKYVLLSLIKYIDNFSSLFFFPTKYFRSLQAHALYQLVLIVSRHLSHQVCQEQYMSYPIKCIPSKQQEAGITLASLSLQIATFCVREKWVMALLQESLIQVCFFRYSIYKRQNLCYNLINFLFLFKKEYGRSQRLTVTKGQVQSQLDGRVVVNLVINLMPKSIVTES